MGLSQFSKTGNSVALNYIWLNRKVTIILTICGYPRMCWVTQNRYFANITRANSHEDTAEMTKVIVVMNSVAKTT